MGDPSIATPTHELCCTFSYFNPQRDWTVQGSIPSVGKMFSLLHTQADQIVGSSSLLYNGSREMVLTIHPHPILRLRMRTAIPLLPFCAFYGMLLGDLYLYV